MDTSTKIALRESIEHWRRMASGNRQPGELPTGSFCSLCDSFSSMNNGCLGCPVAEAGHDNCNLSPYYPARSAWEVYGIDSSEFKAAALKELEFLESLLPKDEHATVPST